MQDAVRLREKADALWPARAPFTLAWLATTAAVRAEVPTVARTAPCLLVISRTFELSCVW
jgi:hypothetical protein